MFKLINRNSILSEAVGKHCAGGGAQCAANNRETLEGAVCSLQWGDAGGILSAAYSGKMLAGGTVCSIMFPPPQGGWNR